MEGAGVFPLMRGDESRFEDGGGTISDRAAAESVPSAPFLPPVVLAVLAARRLSVAGGFRPSDSAAAFSCISAGALCNFHHPPPPAGVGFGRRLAFVLPLPPSRQPEPGPESAGREGGGSPLPLPRPGSEKRTSAPGAEVLFSGCMGMLRQSRCQRHP